MYNTVITAHDMYVARGYHYEWFTHGKTERSMDLFSKVLAHQPEVLSDVTVIAPSQWLSRVLHTAEVTRNCKAPVVPNFLRKREGLATSFEQLLPKSYFLLPTSDTKGSRKGFDVGVIGFLNFTGRKQSHDFRLIVGTTKALGLQSLGIYSAGELSPELQNTNVLDFGIMRTLMHRARGVIIPSRAENFANVGVEAIREGTRLAVSNTGGNPELVANSNHGLLFGNEMPSELGLALIDLSSKGTDSLTGPNFLDEDAILIAHEAIWNGV